MRAVDVPRIGFSSVAGERVATPVFTPVRVPVGKIPAVPSIREKNKVKFSAPPFAVRAVGAVGEVIAAAAAP